MLKNNEGKYLLVRRNPKKYPEVGDKWDIVGGRIEAGTSLIDNLRREIKEEIGLVYQDLPKLVAAQDILRSSDKHVVRLTYVGHLNGEPVVDGDHSAAKWFSAEEIKQMSEMELDSYFRKLVEKGILLSDVGED